MRFHFDNLPEEIRILPQWVCWKMEGGRKTPKNPKTGGNAQSNNAGSWGTFEQALNGCSKYAFDGVGFVFREGGGYFGVDLDHCQECGADCKEIVEQLQSYTEYSQSGTGLHIICKGILPAGRRRKGNVEMYSEGRFFVCTGNIYNPAYTKIVDCTESIKPLHKKYLSDDVHPKTMNVPACVCMDDVELIRQAKESKNGFAFEMLYSGCWEGVYKSQSEADLALCNMLAYWTGCNRNTIDSLFRSSGLMRQKWDERRGAKTYGDITIDKAIAGYSTI